MIKVLLSTTLLLIGTYRLPAPIVENPEAPTPTPAAAESPTQQLHPESQLKNPSSQIAAAPQPSSKRAPLPQTMQQGPALFAGTWTGKIKFGDKGDVQFTLTVNPEATLLKQQSIQLGAHTHGTTYAAQTLSWRAGPKNGIAWTLTPNNDGQTASVTVQVGSANNRAVFHRVKPNSAAALPKPPKTQTGTKLKLAPGH